MRRTILTGLALGLLLAAGLPARAQYYGWGGWGGGSTTAYGDFARGMGVFASGIGQMNLNDAQARSINANTAMQWNNYEWAINQSLYAEYNRRLIERGQETAKNINEIQQRLRNNPTPLDVNSGRALNAILDDFQNPKVQAEAQKVSEREMVPAKVVKQVPFFYSSDPFTFSLHAYMDNEIELPEPLKAKEFEADRKLIRELVDQARKEDLEAAEKPVSDETHKKLAEATRALRTKFEAMYKPNTPEYIKTEPFLKTLTGFTTLLKSSDFEKELAKLKEDQQVSLHELLSFMSIYSLRFAPAENAEEKAAYAQLYPIMAERRSQILSLISQHTPTDSSGKGPGAPPTDMFRPLNFDQLERKNSNKAPEPPKPGGIR